MTIHDPSVITVECDDCGETEEFDTTEYAGDPPSWGVDDDTIEARDWIVVGGEHFCPNCKHKHEG